MIAFILCLCPLLFSFCKCIAGFWFVVALFKYVNLFLYLLALAWWSYRLEHIIKKKKKRFKIFLLCFPTFYDFDILFYVFFLVFSRAAPAAHEGSQARGLIRAVAAGLCQNHINARSEPHPRPTSQPTAMLDPQPTEWRQGLNPQPHVPRGICFCLAKTGTPPCPFQYFVLPVLFW